MAAISKRRETCLKAEKDYFNQLTACKASVCWSKYTTTFSCARKPKFDKLLLKISKKIPKKMFDVKD